VRQSQIITTITSSREPVLKGEWLEPGVHVNDAGVNLLIRREDDDETINRRLEEARREIENYDKYDFILINDKLEESSDNLQAIVESERLRHAGRALSSEEEKIVGLADRHRLANARERVLPILASFRTPSP
jgi:ornithine cyclodeaminase/alanine dehydrogenase-like protein (mu-crystallin family)